MAASLAGKFSEHSAQKRRACHLKSISPQGRWQHLSLFLSPFFSYMHTITHTPGECLTHTFSADGECNWDYCAVWPDSDLVPALMPIISSHHALHNSAATARSRQDTEAGALLSTSYNCYQLLSITIRYLLLLSIKNFIRLPSFMSRHIGNINVVHILFTMSTMV